MAKTGLAKGIPYVVTRPAPLVAQRAAAFRPEHIQDADDAKLERDTGFSRNPDGTDRQNGPAHQRQRLREMTERRFADLVARAIVMPRR